VVGFDKAEKMLDAARSNASACGNVEFRLLDWDCVLPGQNLDRCDVVIASRNGAMFDVEKLSKLAKKKVAVQLFADAPSIPDLIDVLFSGCGRSDGSDVAVEQEPGMPSFPGWPGSRPSSDGFRPRGPEGPEETGRPPMGPPPVQGGRPEPAYIRLACKVCEAGYSPNLRILPERFRKMFDTREEAYAFICSLRPEQAEGYEARVAMNADPFIMSQGNGFEFCIATQAALVWWEV
jgi:hypothetical protein